MCIIRHEIGHYVQQALVVCFSLNLKACHEYCYLTTGWGPTMVTLKSSRKIFFTARSRMLVFIDECGFFYCLASNNTLCWWCMIFIARTPVCTARKERIWPEVATIVHSLIGQNEACSLPWCQLISQYTVLLKCYKTWANLKWRYAESHWKRHSTSGLFWGVFLTNSALAVLPGI